MSVAQLDRASDYGSEGRGFESFRSHKTKITDMVHAMSVIFLHIYPPSRIYSNTYDVTEVRLVYITDKTTLNLPNHRVYFCVCVALHGKWGNQTAHVPLCLYLPHLTFSIKYCRIQPKKL